MKTRTKIILIILLCAALLVPIPVGYKDGGTVEYNAVLYTVRKEHSFAFDGSRELPGYNVGTQVRILFWTVYDDVKYDPEAK